MSRSCISPDAILRQLALCQSIQARLPEHPLAYVASYGCQQNEADSERLRGYLQTMGFSFVQEPEGADLVLLNT